MHNTAMLTSRRSQHRRLDWPRGQNFGLGFGLVEFGRGLRLGLEKRWPRPYGLSFASVLGLGIHTFYGGTRRGLL